MANSSQYAELEHNNQSHNPVFTTAVLKQVLDSFSNLHPHFLESRESRGDAMYLMLRFPQESEFIPFGVTYIAFRGYFSDLSGHEFPSTICLMNIHEVAVFRGTLFNLSALKNFLHGFLKMLKGHEDFKKSQRRMLGILHQLEGDIAATGP